MMSRSAANGHIAGLLYLIVAVTGGFSMLYIPSLIVPGDPAATATSIAGHEGLFRLGIVSGLVCQVVFILLALALYQIFKDVHRTLAVLMVALILAAVPVAFANMSNQLAALQIVTGAGYLDVFSREQSNALAMFFLDQHGQGLLTVEIFWGLWLLPLGLLVMQSGFMPRFLGVLLLIGFVGYGVDFFTRLLFPAYAATVSSIAGFSKFGELAMVLWLLIRGASSGNAREA